MRISDWSSDVCSSDLEGRRAAEAQECRAQAGARRGATTHRRRAACDADNAGSRARVRAAYHLGPDVRWQGVSDLGVDRGCKRPVSCERRAGPFDPRHRSEEHTSELQSLMRISYAVFCLKKKKTTTTISTIHNKDCI